MKQSIRKMLTRINSILVVLVVAAFVVLLTGCSAAQTGSQANAASASAAGAPTATQQEQPTKALGALTPEAALKYMKETKDLVIVDVATTRHYNNKHFEGAIHIPIEELESKDEDALYMKLPAGRPVLIHCRLGMIAPGAYKRVMELRKDIPEMAYIDGVPPFDEYNKWIANK